MHRSHVGNSGEDLAIFQHDTATSFRFALRGRLDGSSVGELEHAWTTAGSIIRDNETVLDLSSLTGADAAGIDLLSRMRESGVRIISPVPPASPDVIRALGLPVAPERESGSKRTWRGLNLRIHRACAAWHRVTP